MLLDAFHLEFLGPLLVSRGFQRMCFEFQRAAAICEENMGPERMFELWVPPQAGGAACVSLLLGGVSGSKALESRANVVAEAEKRGGGLMLIHILRLKAARASALRPIWPIRSHMLIWILSGNWRQEESTVRCRFRHSHTLLEAIPSFTGLQ